MTEKEKMIAGLNYDALNEDVLAARTYAHDLCHALSQVRPSDLNGKDVILKKLIPHAGKGMFITPPFFCDYGWNLHIGKHFYCNTGCIILDAAPVTIGDHVLLGPNVQIYTATHALDPDERAALVESAVPITIGNKVWIGGGAILCPGVNIGDGSIIGAGSVVTRDIPPYVIAVGNPCRIVRSLKDN